MKKVLICVRRLDLGGAEMLECRLADELSKLGDTVHLAGQYSINDFDGANAKLNWLNKGIDDVFFINSGNLFFSFKWWTQLYLKIRKNKYDVIITSNSGLDTYVALIHRFLRFKHIVAFHSYINPTILKSARIVLWKKCLRQVDMFYSITDYVKNNTCTYLGISNKINKTVYNSIVFKQNQKKRNFRKELNIPSDHKIIIMAGRIVAKKGFDLAIKYLLEVLSNESYMIIAGSKHEGNTLEGGLKGFDHELLTMINQLNLSHKISFCGYQENLIDLMKQGDVFVHLARHEGFGLVLLEAIYAGLPIVASNIGGIPEVLSNTPYITFDLDDEEGIQKEVVKYLKMHESELLNVTNQAKNVLEYYSDERRAKEIKLLIEEVCVES